MGNTPKYSTFRATHVSLFFLVRNLPTINLPAHLPDRRALLQTTLLRDIFAVVVPPDFSDPSYKVTIMYHGSIFSLVDRSRVGLTRDPRAFATGGGDSGRECGWMSKL